MNSLMPALIRKDLQMAWPFPVLAILVGLGAIAVWQLGSDGIAIAGIVAFFIVLVVLGTLPMSLIVNERKKQTLPFVMSLPVSALQYAIAKLAAALAMFLVPWVMLVGSASMLIVSRSDIPNGLIAPALVLMLLPLIGFLLTTSVALVSESETHSIVTMAGVNISYSFIWLAVTATPGLTRDAGSAAPVWNETILTALGIELVAIVTISASTLYLQSRKRDFV